MARILVADDDLAQVTVLRSLLEALHYEVGTALSCSEALREMELRPPDLSVVDLRLPQVADGLGLVRSIHETGSRAPLILLSGWPDDLYGAPEEAWVSRVVIKGSVRELLATIAELLST